MDICQEELDFDPNGRSICFCLELRNRVLLGGTYFKKKIMELSMCLNPFGEKSA